MQLQWSQLWGFYNKHEGSCAEKWGIELLLSFKVFSLRLFAECFSERQMKKRLATNISALRKAV